MTPVVTWMIWKVQISPSCTLQVSEIIEQQRAFAPKSLPHGLLRCCSFSMMRWNISFARLMKNNQSVFTPPTPPSIRRSTAALMLWYGEKSDLAPGSGMFLVRLWCAGPGRGHMKGSLCQSSEMFSGSLIKTRARRQTREHAYHTLYKHKSYNAVDKRSILFRLFRRPTKCKSLATVSAMWLKKHHYLYGAIKLLLPPKTWKMMHLFFFCLLS